MFWEQKIRPQSGRLIQNEKVTNFFQAKKNQR